MNKPFYKSTGVMGSLAVIVSALVALAASLASLKGLEITPENQALIVSLVMTMCGGVASLIGRLKASDVVGTGVVLGEMASAVSLAVQPIRTFPAPPEDGACPKCGTKFGAHVLGCPEAGPRKQAEPQEPQADVIARVPWQAQEKHTPPLRAEDVVFLPLGAGVEEVPRPVFPVPVSGDLGATLSRLVEVLERIHAAPEDFVKDQAGCPSKDPAEPMAEGQLVGNPGPVITNG